MDGGDIYEGIVKRVDYDRGYGFLAVTGEADVFFHCRALGDIPFDETIERRRLKFEIEQAERGPRAKNISAA